MEKKNSSPENRLGYYPGYGDTRNIFSYPLPTNDHVIYVDDLSWLEDHQERLQLIRMATPDDSIRLVINSPGGNVAIAMAYVNAIAESGGNIVTHAEGQVCSAGTVLWLASEERTVSPLTVFMFHNYQGGTWGDGANMHSQILFEKEYFDRLIDRFYGDVLTEEEISRIRGGGQVWMDEVQVLQRTPAILLNPENLARMQSGQPPVMIPQSGIGGSAEKRVRISVDVYGTPHVLEAAALDAKSLAMFTSKELLVILVAISKIVGDDVLEGGDINGDTPRGILIENLKAVGLAVSDQLLAQAAEQSEAE